MIFFHYIQIEMQKQKAMTNEEITRKIERNFTAAEAEGIDKINSVYEEEMKSAKKSRKQMRLFYKILNRKIWFAYNKRKDLLNTYKDLYGKTRDWVLEHYTYDELESFFRI